MRRLFLALLVLLVGMAGVFVYTGLTREREFQRLMAEGDQALQNGQTFLAVEAYSGALALKQDSMVVFLKRVETYQQHGDLPAAVRDLSMAGRRDPTSTRPYERLGDVSYALEQYDDAIKHYAEYVRLDDGNPRVLYKLALVNERAGQGSQAIPLLHRALELDARFAEAHYLLGLCLREQGLLEEARAALLHAIDLSPGFLQAREALAHVHHTLGHRRAEFRQLDALAALDQDHPERHVTTPRSGVRSSRSDGPRGPGARPRGRGAS